MSLSHPLPSVLTLPDSDERERRRRRRRFNDNAGYEDGEESDARSVKKFHQNESRQLLNLAATKRTKGDVGFNEVINITASDFFRFDSQEICEQNRISLLFLYDSSTQLLVER